MSEEERVEMINILSSDLNVQGWNQPNCMWVVLGQENNEYLKFEVTFNQDPWNWTLEQMGRGALQERVRGIVLAYETWAYPTALEYAFGSSEALEAYRDIVPAEMHPKKRLMRSVVLVCRDGYVTRCDNFQAEKKIRVLTSYEGCPLTGSTGDTLVDWLRCLLGINVLSDPPARVMENFGVINQIIDRGVLEGWSAERIGAETFTQLPVEVEWKVREEFITKVRDILNEADGQD